MQDLNDLYYFVQVVDHGGFAPAGRALGVPKSKLSRRIAVLEDRLDTRLINRSTRRFTVTELGLEYYRHCVAMLVEAEAAQEVIDRSRAEPRGVVRLSCPPGLIYFHVGQLLVRFMARYPHVKVEIDVFTLRQAALEGLGVVRMLLIVGGRDLTEGRLINVLPGWQPRGGILHAVFRHAGGCCQPSGRYWITWGGSMEEVDFTMPEVGESV